MNSLISSPLYRLLLWTVACVCPVLVVVTPALVKALEHPYIPLKHVDRVRLMQARLSGVTAITVRIATEFGYIRVIRPHGRGATSRGVGYGHFAAWSHHVRVQALFPGQGRWQAVVHREAPDVRRASGPVIRIQPEP